MLTYAQLTALPVQTRPRIIQVVDRGGAAYIIGANADGSTALPMMPNNDAARTASGLGSTSSPAFNKVNTANGITGGLGIGQDMNWVRTGTREVALQNEDGNISGLAKLPAVQLTALSMNGNTISITGNSTINQDVSTGGSPAFAGATINGAVSATGGFTSGSAFTVGGSILGNSFLQINSGSRIYSPTNGQVSLRNNANTADAQLLAGTQTLSGNGAANAPAFRMTGAPFTGGTGTTTLPLLLLEPTGATAKTNWSTNGTVFGVNVLGGFAGDLINLAVGTSTRFNVTSAGTGFFAAGILTQGNLILSGTTNQFQVPSTITPPGTNGAQTINRMMGAVNFAPGATSLVVTNSLVSTTSWVDAVVATNDMTAIVKNVVKSNGSFTINLEEAADAATRVDFFVVNAAP